MDDSYCLLPERISEQFSEIDSDIVMDLAAANQIGRASCRERV